MSSSGFLDPAELTPEVQGLFDDDLSEVGYVMNLSRLWAHQPATYGGLFALINKAVSVLDLTVRQRGILVAACASTFGDSYCALAWGNKLAQASDPQIAGSVLRGDDEGLTAAERAMADWVRKVVRDPNKTGPDDVQELRDAGLTDAQIFAVTVFVGLRLAFSTVNDALGARPDAALRDAPPAVVDAVTFGRPIDVTPA